MFCIYPSEYKIQKCKILFVDVLNDLYTNLHTAVTCKKKQGSYGVTDQWCDQNCRGGHHPACDPANIVHQKCVCNDDSIVFPTGIETCVSNEIQYDNENNFICLKNLIVKWFILDLCT